MILCFISDQVKIEVFITMVFIFIVHVSANNWKYKLHVGLHK